MIDRHLKERSKLLKSDADQYSKDIEYLTKVRDSKAVQLKGQLRSRYHRPSTTDSRSITGIHYHQDSFDWDQDLLKRTEDVFGKEGGIGQVF